MPGRPFPKGVSGNPKGSRPGYKRQLTVEVRALAQRLFDRPYWERKYIELHEGTCNPKIEAVLLSYAFGLPVREVHATGTVVHLGPLQALQAEYDLEPAGAEGGTEPAQTSLVATVAGEVSPPESVQP